MSSGLTTPLKKMKPKSQGVKALEIIEKVKNISRDVWVNKHQCSRVKERFEAIGKGLSDLKFGGANNAHSDMDYPAFDELLITLKKGEVLISNCVKWVGIKGVVSRTDNREAFKEIHEELDTMKAKFPFEGFSGYFETSSGIQSVLLAQDADNDLKEMKNLSNIEKSGQALNKPEAIDLEKVAEVVVEKAEAMEMPQEGGDLPSYLKIDMSKIIIGDPVRKLEILSTHEPIETHGRTLVREASYLDCEFAAKVFKSDDPNWNKEQLLKEVGALMKLRHPHIILYIGFAEDVNFCFLLMEMMRDGDLRNFMKQRQGRPFTPSQELDIITQIAKGMLYLHTQGYAHGDLKCSNILVKKHEDYIEIKIGDLRYSQKLESAGGSWEENSVRRPRWTPPEALDNYGGVKPTDIDDLVKQADVYSFAMTCYEVVTGKLPFQDKHKEALKKAIRQGERPELPEELDCGLKGLIESCWDSDPKNRPVFENICHILDCIKSEKAVDTTKSPGIEWGRVLNSFCGLLCLEQAVETSGHSENMKNQSGRQEGIPEYLKIKSETLKEVRKIATHSENMKNQSGRQEGIPEYLKIKSETLKEVRKLATGGSAEVYEVTWLGCRFAVKRMKLNGAGVISALRQELDFLIKLRHPYIVQIRGFSDDDEQRCSIVMEYMDCNLRDLIDSRREKKEKVTTTNSSQRVLPFEFHEVVSIIKQFAVGMAFLHSKGIVHRDLKSLNMLCQERAGFIYVKIVDFGISEYVAATNVVDREMGKPEGTGLWRAPEILQIQSREGDVDLKAADVYSFAVTCYEIVTGRQPFSEYATIHRDQVVKGLRPTLPTDMDPGLKELIEDCWNGDPNRRPNFVQICGRLNDISPNTGTMILNKDRIFLAST